MQAFIRGSLIIIAAGLLGGCTSSAGPKSAAETANSANGVAGTNTFVMQSGGTKVLKLSPPADLKSEAGDGSVKFTGAQEFQVEIWLVSGATTIDDATAKVPTQIVSEFKDFKPNHTTDLTIAGAPAKRLVGPGHEADDGDNGAADVIVFKVGDRVFVSCFHGESLDPAGQAEMLAIVQTAQLP